MGQRRNPASRWTKLSLIFFLGPYTKKYEGFSIKHHQCEQFGVSCMINTIHKVVYKAFGFSVTSEILLPELPQLATNEDIADISIHIADLSKLWDELAGQQEKFVVKDHFVMFQIPNSAIYCIKGGNQIIVSPLPGSDEDEIRLYILGTCMGAILLQRRVLPLHGSAVAINGKAYAFIGESGAGKSTLASAFLGKGYPLLSDDVIAVSMSQEDKIPFVTPAYPQQKLWQESLEKFGMEKSHYRPIFQRETKYSVPVQSKFAPDPLPLAGVFELVKTNNESIEVVQIQRLERLFTLYRHTFRNFLVNRFGLMAWHLDFTSGIVNKIGLYQLHRPISGFTAPDLASLILTTIDKEG
jgi:hypothetical protein